MYESYLRLSANQLHMKLTKRKLHPAEINKIKDTVAQMKENIRVDKITRANRRTEWTKVLAPLRYELNSAKVGRNYNGDTCPHRIEAFDAYIAVMEKLNAMLAHRAKVLDKTPIQIATAKNLPNNGEHWTDWVPHRIKTPIHDAFMAIPHKPKAKRKIPFERNIRPDPKAKDRLYERTTNEYRTEAIKQKILPSDERAALLAKMDAALIKITQLKPTDFVPHTWHGLYTEKAKESEQ